jgi:hypothetical protein
VVLKEFPNYKIDKQAVVTNHTTGRILTPVLKNGYLGVRLARDGRITYKSLHLLVYDSFVGDRLPGKHIDHINGIRTDNRLVNLRQVTAQQNNSNRLHLVRGEAVNTAKLTPSQVMEIRRAKAAGLRSEDLAVQYGLSKSAVNRIAAGVTWKHLPLLPVDGSVWSNPRITGSMSGKQLREKYGSDYFSKIAKKQRVKKHCDTCSCIQIKQGTTR